MTTVAPSPTTCEAHRAETAAYLAQVPQVREQLLAFADRFAALTDELMAFTGRARALDEHTAALTALAADGADQLPAVVEEVVYQLRRLDPEYGIVLARLWLASFHNRGRAGTALYDLFSCVERNKR